MGRGFGLIRKANVMPAHPPEISAGVFVLGNMAGFFATLFPGTHERK